METKELQCEIADYGVHSDGFLSWEEFYGSSNEDLAESVLEMYDLLKRSSEFKQDLHPDGQTDFEKTHTSFEETTKTKDVNKGTGLNNKKNNNHLCDIVNPNWNCRCIEKSGIEPITRCAACHLKDFQIRSTDIGESKIYKNEALKSTNSNCQSEPSLSQFQDRNPSKCELVSCPAGYSTPSTPVQERFKRLANQLPLSFKRSETYFRWVVRPSSESSLASSTSSSSVASSSFEAKPLEDSNKSAVHLASIESLEGDSDIDREDQKDKSSRFSKETGGSEDSGVHSFCTSLPQCKPKYNDPHLSYMEKVVTEIIETEEVYVGDLRNIIEGYLMKWRSLPDFPLKDRLNVLFGNIETVYEFNNLFLKELKLCGLNPVKIAQCFVKHNTGFSVYTEYCTNYPKTVSLLTELMRQEKTVRLFRERQTVLQHTLPLGSYLLKPVQRILKYHLLLQNIVKQYSNGIDGYKDIVDALRTMTEIAQHINDMKRRHEHEVRVQEIQSLLLGWEGEDLTTFGELCAEGAFRIYGAKALRHVFLFDKMLLITKKKEGGILDYKTHINCSDLMLIESVPGEPLSFHVIPFDNPKLQYTLQCRNLDQKKEWTWQIKRVILENYNAVIPSHARQLVMELGQSKNEDDVHTNKILTKRHHLAPEYLEKRKQERGKSDSSFKCRMQRSKKLAGNKIENQFIKLTSQHSTPLGTQSDALRQDKEEAQILKENLNNSSYSEKMEFRTLEQIVTQILKQNTEFDKILKRQKHILLRSRDSSSRRKKKKDLNLKPGKTVQDTLKNFKLFKSGENEMSKTSDETESSFYAEVSPLRYDNEEHMSEENSRSQSFTNQSRELTKEFSKITLDDGIPTSPSVWLRQQVKHLPVASKKAGSLPRSFQINSEPSHKDPRFFRDFKFSAERPFTIASDKISSTMLFEGMERFCRSQFHRFDSNTNEDGSITDGLRTPGTSLDQINIHPEYKIYRSGLSANILKNLLSSVHSKLTHIKMDVGQKLEPDKKVLSRERKTGRMIYMLAKHYHKSLRFKQKDKNFENYSCNQSIISTVNLPVYKQGSESLGARLANFTESEFRINKLRCSKKAAAVLGVYSDSVISLQYPQTIENSHNNCEEVSKNQINSAESFYEKRLEEMDAELLKLSYAQEQEVDEKEERNDTPEKTPPAICAKPGKELIIEKVAERSRNLLVLNINEEPHLSVQSEVEVPMKHENKTEMF